MDTLLPVALTDHDLEHAHGGAFAVSTNGLDKNPGGFLPHLLKGAEQLGTLLDLATRAMV